MIENTFFDNEKHEILSLDEIARIGAQQMLRLALEAEIAAFLEAMQHRKLEDGRAAIVRNGTHKPRNITVGSGTITISVPRTRSRDGGENYKSIILPPYMRRSPKIDEVVPLLYLRGLSNGDIYPALSKLLGNEVSGLSSANITRLKANWQQQYEQWRKRDLSTKKYCYIWVDGIHFNVRFGDNRLCVLVIIGATKKGQKELIAVESGYRESAESWRFLLRQLKQRGLKSPCLAIGDGALGFWIALREVYPECKEQRCWVHKTANVLDKLPKHLQKQAKRDLYEIYNADTKERADKAFDAFIRNYQNKYPKAVDCLVKDRESLLSFYDFPAVHWQHIRSTNPIESAFATVRLRSDKTRGHGTETTTLMMVYKLIEQASNRWQKLRGSNMIELVITGHKFINGELQIAA